MFKWKFKQEKNGVSSLDLEGMTLEQARDGLLQLMADESTNHHRMGQIYNYVVKKELAQAAGFKDARDYFSQKLKDMSQTALTLYGAVADGFSEEVARNFGVTCLYLLLTYKEAADIKINHEEPGPTLIEVPDAKGVVTPKVFSDCSVDEMRRAIQRKRKPSSSKPLPEEDLVLAEQVEQEVLSRFTKGTKVRVEVRNEQGTAVLDYKGIPLHERKKLGAALMAPLPGESTPPAAPEAPVAPEVPAVLAASGVKEVKAKPTA
ncbi:MAG: hypothetical protein ACJ8AT_14655 [Hyalangium sp.]|uniref:hypothetical protein n=1 Tax=Hyalangium sp. TaxID=2028555 RepID=UPI00389AE33D